MAANLPEITYRSPTLQSGVQASRRPSIVFDWSTDMVTTQFSDDAQRAANIILLDDATSTVLSTDFVSYTAASRRVTLQPSSGSLLDSNKLYRIIIKSKLQSSDGRKSFNEYNWTFQTASGSAGDISLYAPGDTTVQPTPPTLSWSAVTFAGSASGGTVQYIVQVDNRFDFGSVNYTTTTTSTSALPNHTYTDNTTYFWRVMPYTVGATGSWSDVWQYYYGRLLDSDPTTRQFLPDADVFGIKSIGFKSGDSNLRSFPTPLSLTFFSIPASTATGYVQVWKKSVLPRNDDDDTYLETAVGGTWALSGSTLTFTPSDTFANNTRYEIKVLKEMRNTGGYTLDEDYSFWFTSKYAPFYVSPRVIRARFLGAEQKVPDDLINFYIFQASLEANARYWSAGDDVDIYIGDSLSEATVRDSASLTSYGVLKWVEAAASYKILKAILFEHLRDIGRTQRLGDSLVSLTKDFIAGIDKALELVADELSEWQNYLTPSDMPATVAKSFGWSPSSWDYDWSVRDLEGKRDDGFDGYGGYGGRY